MSFLLIKVGREELNDIIITDERVSAQHLEIFVDVEGNVYLTDLNSELGTFVNGQRISDAVELQSGDEVRISNAFALNWEQLIAQAKRNSFAIGSEVGNDLVLTEEDVDPRHVQIFKDFKGNIFVNDLKSINGTFINGHRIQGVALIQNDDRLKLGKQHYQWQELFVSGRFPMIDVEPIEAPKVTQPIFSPEIEEKTSEVKVEKTIVVEPEKDEKPKNKIEEPIKPVKNKWLKVALILVIDALLILWLTGIL